MMGMDTLEALFGIKAGQIKATCLLMPYLPKGLVASFGIRQFHKGQLYAAAQTASLTLIRTGIGAALAADAALYLEPTPCRQIIFFGACGLVRPHHGLVVGSLVSPFECYALDSFTRLLQQTTRFPRPFRPDQKLLEKLSRLDKAQTVVPVRCTTFGSLKLEEAYRDTLIRQEIDVVDMECAAVLAAARHIRRRALALLYITDIIGQRPFYAPPSPREKSALRLAVNKAAGILSGLAST